MTAAAGTDMRERKTSEVYIQENNHYKEENK